MDVSIIIVNYNTSKLTCQTINSVIQNTVGLTYEIIVIDNNSCDSSSDDIIANFGNKVKLIVLPENIGFGRANNQGISVAKGRNVLLLNPDTILLDNPIKTLSNYLDKKTAVGAVGGNLFTPQMTPAHSFERNSLSIWTQINELLFCLPTKFLYGKNSDFNNSTRPLKVKQIVGADLMVRKSVIDNIGVFDPDFFMYREESELCYRISNAGYQLVVLPDAKIIHIEGQSFNVKETREIMWLTGTRTYMLKTHRRTYYNVYMFLYLMTIRVHSLKCIILGKKQQLQFWRNKLDCFKKFNSDKNGTSLTNIDTLSNL